MEFFTIDIDIIIAPLYAIPWLIHGVAGTIWIGSFSLVMYSLYLLHYGGQQKFEEGVQITLEERKRADKIINFVFRDSIEECLVTWFGKSNETDEYIWQNFANDVALASSGKLRHWEKDPRMCVALIILLDQFRRNMYRGKPEMYACDPDCIRICDEFLATGLLELLTPAEMVFLPCLVYTHSEELHYQQKCMQQFANIKKLLPAGHVLCVFEDVFRRHLNVIEKFGRFPHRNAILDRKSSTQELVFLSDATYRFDLPLIIQNTGAVCFMRPAKLLWKRAYLRVRIVLALANTRKRKSSAKSPIKSVADLVPFARTVSLRQLTQQ